MSSTRIPDNGVVVIGCRHNTAEFIRRLIQDGKTISGIITLNQEAANKANVPSWMDLKKEFGSLTTVYEANTYKLTAEVDKKTLEQWKGKFALVVGWQRILPNWLLNNFHVGIFGQHACQFPLPRGRGRSPIHWSIISGAESVFAHIFKYETKADSGAILAMPRIEITESDDTHSVQQKCRVAFNNIINQKWNDLINNTITLKQQLIVAEHLEYPKRTQGDGGINWYWPVKRITDWIRAQTHPYPGAYCVWNSERFTIWKAQSFNVEGFEPTTPGTVLEVFTDQSILIQAGDGVIWATEHNLPQSITTNQVIRSISDENRLEVNSIRQICNG